MLDVTKSITDTLLPHVIKTRVEGDMAQLAILSDIHQGANLRPYLQESVKFLLSLGPNCKVIIGGDSTNTTTKHSKGSIIEEWGSGDAQINTLVDDIRPLYESGQLIGITSGNHPNRVFDDTYITIEMMVASLLGDRSLYKGAMGIVYFNVNKNLYIYSILHKHRMTEGFYDYMAADVNVFEHLHKPMAKPKVMIEHNKYTKTPVVRRGWDLYQSSFQIYPDYAKKSGMRPQIPGYFICEMGGKDRYISPYLDEEYQRIMGRRNK